jgi:hypothetical protein
MTGFHPGENRLDYPAADRLVMRYLREHRQRPRTTSVDVLEWSDYPNNHHNRNRVYDSLKRFCTPTESNWAGRTVFETPDELPEP